MLSFLSKTGLNHFWLHIVARIGQANQQILSSLGALATKDTVAKTDLDLDVQVSLGKADSAIQVLPSLDKYYSPDNLPPYPVSSVNGLTGEVKINALPDYSTLNNDQFLRIIQGTPTWVTVPNAEEATF